MKDRSARNELQSYTDKPQFCDNYGMESLNGILLSYYPTSSNTSVLTARKNNLQLWEANTSSPTDCDATSAVNKTMYPRSVSVGGDGNFYMVLTYLAGDTAMACPERLFGVDKDTGVVIMDEALTTPSSATYNKTQAWTYEDYVLVLDRAGTLHKFEYDGDEVTNADYPYEFEITTGRMFYLSAANSAGTVYVMSATTSYGSNALMYHTDSGDDGSISNTIHSTNASAQYTFDKDGNFIHIIGNQYLDLFSLSGGTVSSITPSNTSGYPSAYIIDYVEDGDGNALVQWELSNSGTSTRAISIDFIDGSSSAITNLFLESGTGNARPSGFPNLGIDRSIANGYLYLSLCKDQSSGCGNGSNPPDSWIYRVDVGDFGDPVTHLFGQSSYMLDTLEYVALGDSFSSGEGNPDFSAWTDIDDTNECHRSIEDAFPVLVSEQVTNINLVDFVACSGATTTNVTSGGSGAGSWGGPPQTDTLSSQTDIVSLTVGGNDIGFSEYATFCAVFACGPGSANEALYDAVVAIAESNAFSSSLQYTYEQILNKAENANVYVMDYPYIADPSGTDTCIMFLDTSGSKGIQDALNTAIANAVSEVKSVSNDFDNRLHLVQTNTSGSQFEDRWLCTDIGDEGFNGVDAINTEYSVHPNATGQAAYKDLLINALP